MTDKEYARCKDIVLRTIETAKEIVSMKNWDVSVFFYREGFSECANSRFQSLFIVESMWMYERASIDVNCPMVMELDEDGMLQSILHELLHCVVSNMRKNPDKCSDNEEFVVTRLSKIVYNLYMASLRRHTRKKVVKSNFTVIEKGRR